MLNRLFRQKMDHIFINPWGEQDQQLIRDKQSLGCLRPQRGTLPTVRLILPETAPESLVDHNVQPTGATNNQMQTPSAEEIKTYLIENRFALDAVTNCLAGELPIPQS